MPGRTKRVAQKALAAAEATKSKNKVQSTISPERYPLIHFQKNEGNKVTSTPKMKATVEDDSQSSSEEEITRLKITPKNKVTS